jgi:membrane fusion protein (multidrug efflux system)
VFSLPEIALALAHVGTTLDVKVVPYADEAFSGEVYFVAPTLDARNRRLLIKAIIDNPDHRLRPGMFANIRVEVANKQDALVVPEAAIAYDADGTFVWRVRSDGTPERVPIETGIRRANRVEVTSGLKAGDRIVSGGTHKVNPGSVLSEAAGSEPAPAAEARQG